MGAELGAAYRFPAGHSVYLNYAYTRATFQSEADIFSIRSLEEGEDEERRSSIRSPPITRSRPATACPWCPTT